MLEITATTPERCVWPGCTKGIWEGCRVVYATSDSAPVHAYHYAEPQP